MSFTFNGQAVTNVTFNGSAVQSISLNGNNRWSSIPDAPTNLGLAVSDDDTIQVTWTVAENATGYTIAYGTSASNLNSTQTVESGNQSYVYIGGLSGNTTYYFKIRSDGAAGSSAYTSTASSAKTNPGNPTNLSTTSIQPTVTNFSWTAQSGATRYVYGVRKDGSTSYNFKIGSVTTNTLSLTGLTEGTGYTLRIQSQGDNYNYSDHSYIEWDTPLQLPEPTFTYSYTDSSISVTPSISSRSAGVQYFEVKAVRVSDGATTTNLTTVATPSTNFTASSSSDYEIRVRALANSGYYVSTTATQSLTTWGPYTYTITPSLNVTDTADDVSFTWTEDTTGSSSNSTRQLYYRWKVDTNAWTAWTLEPWADFYAFNMSSIYGQYQQGQTIYFELKATDNNGTTWATASASQYVTIQAPVSMVASFIDDDSVRLDWDASRTRPFGQLIMQYRHANTEAGVSSASWVNWYQGYSAVSYNILTGATGGNYYQFRGHLTPDSGLSWSDWKESNIQQTAPANMVINLFSPQSNYQRIGGSGSAQPTQTSVKLWRRYKTSAGSTSSLTSWTSYYNTSFYTSATSTSARSGTDFPIPPYTSFYGYMPYNRYGTIVSYSFNDAGASDATYDYGYSNIPKPYLTNAYNDGYANMGVQFSYTNSEWDLHIQNQLSDYVDEVFFTIKNGNGSNLSWWKINFTTGVYSTSGSTETVGWYDPADSLTSPNGGGTLSSRMGSINVSPNTIWHVNLKSTRGMMMSSGGNPDIGIYGRRTRWGSNATTFYNLYEFPIASYGTYYSLNGVPG